MLWGACCFGFSGFLCLGEFMNSPNFKNKWQGLSPQDIIVNSHSDPSFLSVTLTDWFGAGHTLYIGTSGNHHCPVAEVFSFLAIHPSLPGPLFIYEDGRPLYRNDLVAAIRMTLRQTGVDVSHFNAHSFHIGAAMAAASTGLPDCVIQTLGR